MSFTDIANRALRHLGQSITLSDVSTDTTPAGVTLYSFQNTALRTTLKAADWDFATWSAALTTNESSPDDMANEWDYSYDMPTAPECLKPRRIVNGDRNLTPGSQIPFRVVANIAQRFTITAATAANPVVITTSATHTFAANNTVYIEGVVGMTQLNGLRFTVATPTNTTFELSGVNGSAYSTYTSGGYAQRANTLIYTDEDDAYLEYTRLVTDTDLFPDEFSLAMSYKWAALAAPAITGGDPYGLGSKAERNFEIEISKAITRDANKRQWDTPPESEFTRDR